jgi:hypothetical protein
MATDEVSSVTAEIPFNVVKGRGVSKRSMRTLDEVDEFIQKRSCIRLTNTNVDDGDGDIMLHSSSSHQTNNKCDDRQSPITTKNTNDVFVRQTFRSKVSENKGPESNVSSAGVVVDLLSCQCLCHRNTESFSSSSSNKDDDFVICTCSCEVKTKKVVPQSNKSNEFFRNKSSEEMSPSGGSNEQHITKSTTPLLTPTVQCLSGLSDFVAIEGSDSDSADEHEGSNNTVQTPSAFDSQDPWRQEREANRLRKALAIHTVDWR